MRVFFSADVSEDQLPALDDLARLGEPAAVVAGGEPVAIRPAADSELLTAAEAAMTRWLHDPSYAGGQEYRGHVLYWLRVAADVAHRSGS